MRPSRKLKAALLYARRGWPVVPIHSVHDGQCTCGADDCQSPGKHPRSPHGLKDATADETVIEHWWAKWPNANVAVATGSASGLLVLDVDPRNGGDESLKKVLGGREIPRTPTVRTGGGGSHFYFQLPQDATIKSRPSGLDGLDIKAEGGYVIAPQSLHQSGNRYLWADDFSPSEVSLAKVPLWLKQLLSKPKAKTSVKNAGDGQPITEGGRHDFLLRAAGGLRRQGATVEDIQVALLALNRNRCSPPLQDDEVGSITQSAESWEPGGNAQYTERPAGLFLLKPTRDGIQEVKLTNFSARIVCDLIQDDGMEKSRSYIVKATVCNNHPKEFVVDATHFEGMKWATEHLGPTAVVSAGFGVRDHARVAIQQLSGTDIEQEIVFAHSGWRQFDGKWFYLHCGGAIGADGARSDVKVHLPDCLSSFKLPKPPKGDRLRDAVRESLKFLSVGPRTVTHPIYNSIWRAVEGYCDFSLSLTGPTGAGKTVLAALAQQHFGAGFNDRHLPASWSSTANANEGLSFLAKDALLVIDDFAPAGTRSDLSRFHKDADRILRAQGNSAGRSRMRPDATLRGSKAPRGLILSTGEDVPRGHSLRARIFVVELSPDSLDWDLITECQKAAKCGIYAQVLSGFLFWSARHYERIRQRWPERIADLREDASRSEHHRRTAGIVADLQLSMNHFLKFGMDCGALSERQVVELMEQNWEALGLVARAQCRHQKSEDPVNRFLQLMQSLLASGRVYLKDLESVNAPTPKGEQVGWIEDGVALLNPEAAFAAAQKLAQDQGDFLTIGQKMLWSRMRDRGILVGSDADRNLKRETIMGDRQRVVKIPMRLLSLDHAESGQ